NPTVAQATAGITQSEAVLQQVRASTLPALDVAFTTNTISPVTRFSGTAIVPRSQTQTLGGLAVPLVVPVRWAQRNQAGDQVYVSEQNEKDVRKQIAVSAAQAYLEIIARRHVLELNERARDNAREHYDYANQLFQGGLGSRLNAVRALQEVSSDEARVEEARLAVRLAQEALGVLVAADGPIDTADEPDFEMAEEIGTESLDMRTDVQLANAREAAAQRVFTDSWKDHLPSLAATFSPQVLAP